MPEAGTVDGLSITNPIRCQLWPQHLATCGDSAGFLCKSARSIETKNSSLKIMHYPEHHGNASVSKCKCTHIKDWTVHFWTWDYTVEWPWPITQDTGSTQLPFSGVRRSQLGRCDLFFFSILDSSIPKTSVRTEGLPGKPAGLNSNPAQPAEMWEVGILRDNQDQGSTWHKQCFETHKQRTRQPRLSAEGVGRYQNCSSFLQII